MNHDLIPRIDPEQGFHFSDSDLLRRAFVHRSYMNEMNSDELSDNERLEFVGDAILGFLVSEWLFLKFPESQEGELTKVRAALVRRETLARFARRLDFGQKMLLGRGEEESGGRRRPSLLCDVFEAFVGALYLDQGLEVARAFVIAIMEEELALIVANESLAKDAKSRLQEWSQGELGEAPRYKVVATDGPDHARVFVTQALLLRQPFGVGRGCSKQESSQAAAAMALHRLQRYAPEYDPDPELETDYPLPDFDPTLLSEKQPPTEHD